MKSTLLLFLAFFYCQSQALAQKKEKEIPNQFKLIIQAHGLSKSASSFYAEYEITDLKLNYFYNHTGGMGISDTDEHATKKFPSRAQYDLYTFLENAKDTFNNQEIELDGHGDDSEKSIEIILSYTLNGEEINWSLKGGEKPVKLRSDYKKILELEGIIRNWVGLNAR